MTQSWTYTLTGQVRTETNGAFTATYEYDELWRLRVVRENGVVQATYTYDVNGNRASKAYANGVVTTYTYNHANMVTRLENRRGTATLSSYSYVYQLDGNMVRKTDHTGRVTAFTYDGLGRLVREQESGAADAKTYVYTFDGRGNRASMVVSGAESYRVDYTYDVNNRLLTSTKTQPR